MQEKKRKKHRIEHWQYRMTVIILMMQRAVFTRVTLYASVVLFVSPLAVKLGVGPGIQMYCVYLASAGNKKTQTSMGK